MPRPPLSAEDRNRTRGRILAAARDLFETGGAPAVSMRAVGARVGLTASALYAYFPAKDDLIRALWQDSLDQLEARLRALSAAEPDPVRALIALGHAYAAFGLEDPVRFRLLFFAATPPGAHDLPPDAPPSAHVAYHVLHERVAQAIALGRSRIDDVDLACQTLWASLHGVVALINGCSDFPFLAPDLLVETMIETTLRGMARDCTEESRDGA